MTEFLTFSKINQLKATTYFSETDLRLRASKKENQNIFLSYSSKDKNYLPGVIKLLEDNGGVVYIDEGDTRLPQKPSQETAAILRNSIQKLDRFVLFVTTNSKDSIWIPWELGLGDAYKTLPNVALLPTADSADEQEWAEREYLGLYKRIVWGWLKGENQSCWIVYDHIESSGQKLSSWIRGY